MNIENLQEELAGAQRTLDFLTTEVARLDAIFIEQRALADETTALISKSQHIAKAIDALRDRDVMATRRFKQEGIVNAVRNRIEDERLQRISNLQMFDRLQRQSAAIFQFPSNNTPESA